jgi:predicted acyltransferase
MGMNAIVIYLASEFLDEALGWIRWSAAGRRISLHAWLYDHLFASIASPYNASLLFALAYVLVLHVLAWGLYRRRWFVRV